MKSLALTAFLLAGTPAAQAAIITWSAAANITSDSDISTEGTLVRALNLGQAVNHTINGVTFNGYDSNVSSSTGTYNVTTGIDEAGSWGGNFNFTGYNPGTETRTIGAAYRGALSSGELTPGSGMHTQTLSGLMAGQLYQIQVWYNDVRTGTTVDNGRVMLYDSGVGTSTASIATDGDPRFGQFVIGTFTADGTSTQTLRWDSQSGQQTAINMFQIRAIPEPSVALLGGLGLLGLLRRRRRN